MNRLEDLRPVITSLLMGATGCAAAAWEMGYKIESIAIGLATAFLFVVYMHYSWSKPFWERVMRELNKKE